jgi:hypothetical protein
MHRFRIASKAVEDGPVGDAEYNTRSQLKPYNMHEVRVTQDM